MRIGKRIEIEKGCDAITARIKGPNLSFVLLLFLLWLIIWTAAGITVISQLAHELGYAINKRSWASVAYLVGALMYMAPHLYLWLIAEVAMVFVWLGCVVDMVGCDVVLIRAGILTHERKVFGFTVRKKEFLVREISNLRATRGSVAFKHGKKSFRLGDDLEEQVANALAKELEPFLTQTM